MPVQIAYPATMTDGQWKKLEQKAGVSDTGIGKALRDLEKAVKTFNATLAKVPGPKTKLGLAEGDKDLVALSPLLNSARAAGRQAFAAVDGSLKSAKTPAAKTLLTGYSTLTKRYRSELDAFDLDDAEGLEALVKRFNTRVG